MRKVTINKLNKLINGSKNILLMSHVGADPDAISCTHFTLEVLRWNFPEKQINANIESVELEGFSRLFNKSNITSFNAIDAVKKYQPQLIIVLDLNELRLLSRQEERLIKDIIKAINIVRIDHHPVKKERGVLLTINDRHNSCAETVYEVFLKRMKLKNYPNFSNHLLLGIIADTGNFAYLKGNNKHTFDTVYELTKLGGNLDVVNLYLNRMDFNMIEIHKEFLKNLTIKEDYSYSYISDEFYKKNPQIKEAQYSSANKIFVQWYIKKVGEAFWGFTLKPISTGDYTLSMRAQEGSMDLTRFAIRLGGDGHKTSAGGLVKANNLDMAIKQVLDIIEKYKEEAYANK